MTETLGDVIQGMIDESIKSLAKPEIVKITKTYDDNHADCTSSLGKVYYVPVIANHLAVGNTAVLFETRDNTFILISK